MKNIKKYINELTIVENSLIYVHHYKTQKLFFINTM